MGLLQIPRNTAPFFSSSVIFFNSDSILELISFEASCGFGSDRTWACPAPAVIADKRNSSNGAQIALGHVLIISENDKPLNTVPESSMVLSDDAPRHIQAVEMPSECSTLAVE